MIRNVIALAAWSVAAASPIAAQPSAVPVQAQAEMREEEEGLEGEVWGYLALPILLVLTALIGFAIGGDDEAAPASP